MAGLKEIADQILEMTDGGLDIILEIYPNADTRKNFRIRDSEDDQNPSASLYKKEGDNRYRLNDFGGNIKSQDCFGLYADYHSCDYAEAIVAIAQKLQQERGVQLLNTKTQVFKYDYREWKLKK